MVLGVIAAITLPSLINNTNAHEYRSKLKKAVSGLNQALTLHYALEGLTIDDYSSVDDLINNVFKKRMNVIEINDNTFKSNYEITQNYGGCIPTSENSFVTQDGTVYCFPYVFSTEGHQWLYVDVNGQKPPNRVCENSAFPTDQYWVYLSKSGVYPDNVARAVMYEEKGIEEDKLQPPEEEPDGVPPAS